MRKNLNPAPSVQPQPRIISIWRALPRLLGSARPARRTLGRLIRNYQTDQNSTYWKLRYHVRIAHDGMLRRIEARHGNHPLGTITGAVLLGWHAEWSAGGKIANGHAFISQLRTVFGFGATLLDDAECERLCSILHKMRFQMSRPRTERMLAEQAIAIRLRAHDKGWPSIALAQAFQFELMLRQKDVIGEWIPIDEPGESDVTHKGFKWLRGIRWDEIDEHLILRHTTSKRGKPIEVDLHHAAMVMEEFALIERRPTTGPAIICEFSSRPFRGGEFRRKWRIAANEAGVPATVFNMDSRAGAITEADEAGADPRHIQQAATHSDFATTQRYIRSGYVEKTADVMARRQALRKKRSTPR